MCSPLSRLWGHQLKDIPLAGDSPRVSLGQRSYRSTINVNVWVNGATGVVMTGSSGPRH